MLNSGDCVVCNVSSHTLHKFWQTAISIDSTFQRKRNDVFIIIEQLKQKIWDGGDVQTSIQYLTNKGILDIYDHGNLIVI